MTRGGTLTGVLLACLIVGLSACGGDSSSSGDTALLTPAADPAEQLEAGQNAVRIGGLSPSDVAGQALLATDHDGEQRPTTWFLLREDLWHEALLAAQFAAAPIGGALLPIDRDFLPTASIDLLARVKVKPYPHAKGLKAIVMGKVDPDVFIDLHERKLKATQLLAPNPFELSEKLVPFVGGGAGKFSSSIVIASAEQREFALPAAAWSAYSGDTLAFVNRDGVPAPTERVVAQREKLRLEKPTMYVIGPESVISDRVVSQLERYGRVERIAGETAAETSVELARYHDPATLFGWNMKKAPASVSLVNTAQWANSIGAFLFAARGPQAPLLLTDSPDELPEPVLQYLQEIGARGKETSQGFVFGDRDSISSNVLGQMEAALRGKKR